MNFHDVTRALAGGALIGGAASALLFLNGRIAGISGVVAGLLPPRPGEISWRVAFLLGLLTGGAVLALIDPSALPQSSGSSSVVALAGLLVGIGTRLSNGCTSGHGVCGLARRSRRSLVATATFISTGALTVYVVRHVLVEHLR